MSTNGNKDATRADDSVPVACSFVLPDPLELRESAARNSLEHCDVLYKVTDEELREQFNGVGPDRWPKEIRNILSGILWDVLEAVEIHDVDYYIGGDRDEFHEANLVLGKNVRKLARRKYRWWKPRRWFLVELSYRMTELTERYGWEGWNKKQTEKDDKGEKGEEKSDDGI